MPYSKALEPNLGYGVVFHRKDEEPQVVSGYVGKMTDNVSCEVRGM